MQTIIKSITDRIELLEKHCSEIRREISSFHWGDDEMSAQILQSDLDHIEAQIPIARMVNCTPHQINIEGLGELRPSGILPRVSTHSHEGYPVNGVRVRHTSYNTDTVTGLPDPVDGLVFIVSGMVRDALSALPTLLQRPDVYAPDTGADAVRNEQGHIVAVRGLVQ